MLASNRVKLFIVLAAALCTLLPVKASAQKDAKPYTLAQVLGMVGDVPNDQILVIVTSPCVNFRINQNSIDILRAKGATNDLIAGLRRVCYKGDTKDSDEGGNGGNTSETKKVVVTPKPKKKVVVPDPRPYTPPVVNPPTVIPAISTNTTGSVDWDFRSNRALSSGRYGNCQFDYSPSGYTVSVMEYGGSCLDGSMIEWGDNIRVTTVATPVSGAPGFTYGLRFGISDDASVGYYALEVSSYGHYELSRYRNGAWEVVFPWKTGSGINANSANTITAVIRGSAATFIINGITQETYQAPRPLTGRVGFGIIGFDKDPPLPVVTFQSFTVSGTRGPATTTTTPTVPTTTTPITTGSYDWDFASSQPLTSGRFGKCDYQYASGGYNITVAEAGTTCFDGPGGDQPANVRVSATARGLRGLSGYTYGLRLGYTTDSTIGYYAFEVSEGGSFQLSRYRMNRWEPLIPWQRLSVINPASSGQANVITAEIRGTALTLFVNNSQVGTYNTPYPVAGTDGFGIIGYEQSEPLPSVVFSHFSLTPLGGTTIPATTTSSATDWDFRTSQPLSSGRYGKCDYQYSSSGYTISVAEAGSTCIDGPAGDQPASIRVSTTAYGVSGQAGYTYGLRLGYTKDSTVGYYAFEVSQGGSFQLSRYRMGRWEALIPWQRLTVINPSGSGSNTLTADIRGTSMTFYVNGTQVGTYQTPYPPVGPAGFGIIGYEQSAPLPVVTFTKFSVTPL